MINISKIKYDIAVLLPQGERLSLTNVANGLSWSEQSGELAVSLQFRILNQKLGDGWLHKKLPLGARTLLRADWGESWQEIHQGIIFDWEYENDSVGSLNVKSYDNLIYLLRSKDDRYYPNGTKARVIVEDIAKAWNIPIGQNDLPDTALSKQVFRGDTLGAMLDKVLEQVKKRGGGKYVIRASGGKINVLRQGQNKTVYRFEEDIVRRMTDKQDIEDLVTRVKIIGKENKAGRAPIVATLDGKTEFGILQDVIYREQYDTAAAAKAAAQEVIKERGNPRKRRTIVSPDLPFLRRGDKIFVSAGTIEGHFVVVGIQHDADTRTMTMEVDAI
ncbi:MAG: hypothetical protein E7L01_09850 [Paenibacillus macerans]|uniref:XkdQ/YqbQ family protein n=1 Tax=Paenibacillus macerans TaxID=44252 RepID=UPI001F0E2935|nr:hypothetical protein [Paenibacillus macerans]MDU5949607.1 hypothetical protein [Paenibacillus macerans]MDU7473629.1 hypothetical protein [Paenibacillus macerans]MEC0139213.1 hypothetical protein [Paenibacillus macerans]UMV47294.1 hypothetical protein LMZ02_28210 [Paenibacillus macerans]